MIFTFLFELARFAVDVWAWRAKCKREFDQPERHFSWVALCEKIIYGFGMPILAAYVVYPRSFEASALALVSVFILKPRATPLIAIPAKRLLGTGYGAQLLFVDSLIALSGLVIVIAGGLTSMATVPVMFSGPQNVRAMNFGLFITFLPLLVVYGIYQICNALFVFFLGMGLLIYWLFRYSRVVKWAGSILLFW